MMAAIWASRQGKKVCLVEQNGTLGQKLLLSGGGRCNFTNAEYDHNQLIQAYGREGAFLHSAFTQFSPKETLEFFYNLGMGMKVEENNPVFPKSDRAQDLLGHLQKELQKHEVEVLFNTKLLDLQKSGKKIEKATLESNGQKMEIKAERYILAGGGKSYPKTGSNGSLQEILKRLGHKVGAIRPALTPINIKEKWTQNLQGISARDIKVKIFQNNQRKYEFAGDVLFTHFGLSGPAILDAS